MGRETAEKKEEELANEALEKRKKKLERKREYREKNKQKKREYDREYREKDKQKKREYDREYREKNKQKKREYDREYREKNKQKLNAYNNEHREKNKQKRREHYTNNKEKILEQSREYYTNNKEKILEQSRQYYTNNKEKIRGYYTKNKEKLIEYQRQYREKNKQKLREYRKRTKDSTKSLITEADTAIDKHLKTPSVSEVYHDQKILASETFTSQESKDIIFAEPLEHTMTEYTPFINHRPDFDIPIEVKENQGEENVQLQDNLDNINELCGLIPDEHPLEGCKLGSNEQKEPILESSSHTITNPSTSMELEHIMTEYTPFINHRPDFDIPDGVEEIPPPNNQSLKERISSAKGIANQTNLQRGASSSKDVIQR